MTKRIFYTAIISTFALAGAAKADYTLNANAYPVPPRINSVYASPMQRSVEVPAYGRNKYMYFRDQKKTDEGDWSGNGLYAFASFLTGSSAGGGLNLENEYDYGSTGNSTMGDTTGLMFGFGRRVNSKLSMEISYSTFNGMRYGDWTRVLEEMEEEEEEDLCIDPETGEDLCAGDEGAEGEELAASTGRRRPRGRGLSLSVARHIGPGGNRARAAEGNHARPASTMAASEYYQVSGGDIKSDFVGVGLVYRFDNFNLGGTSIKPYVGAHFGYASNKIDDYVVEDPDGWIIDDGEPENSESGDYYDEDGNPDEGMFLMCNEASPCVESTYYDGTARFFGETTRNFGYALEAGISIPLESNLSLDIFYRMNKFGRIATSGRVLTEYTVEEREYMYLSQANVVDGGDPDIVFDPINDVPDPDRTLDDVCYSEMGYDGVDAGGAICEAFSDPFQDQSIRDRTVESGTMNMNVFGIKLKYTF
ncbi:MAG: hypothetical protein LBH41_00165 [Rickettsiales bacterium]|nr:hypothetical protein [Rickettsiales bacterium]